MIDGLFNIIFLGPPGSGKGTQAYYVAKYFNLEHISTGEIIRFEIKEKTNLGKEIQKKVQQGEFPSDDLVLNLLEKNIKPILNKGRSIILDGFPRTLYQAKMLDNIFQKMNITLLSVLFLGISNQNSLNRLIGRFSCIYCEKVYHETFAIPKKNGSCDICNSKKFKQRGDDSREIAQKRLTVYDKQTLPIVNFYKQKGLLEHINAENTINSVKEKIFDKIFLKLNNTFKNKVY